MSAVARIRWGLATVVLGFFLVQGALSAAGPEAAFDYPVRAFNDGNYRIAHRGFQQFLDQYPDHEWSTEARYWKAESLLYLDNYDRALDELLTVLQEDPAFSKGEIVERLALAAEGSERIDEVRQHITLRILNEQPRLQNYLIDWFYEEEPDRVVTRLRAIEPNRLTDRAQQVLEGEESRQRIQVILDLAREDDWDPSIRDELEGLESDLRHNVLALVAKRLWEQGNQERILRFGREFSSRWGGLDFSLYVAEAAIELEEWQLAEKYYDEIANWLDYQPPEAAYGRAWIAFQRGDLSKARDMLEPHDWERLSGRLASEALRLRGDVALERGNYQQAQKYYEKVLDRNLDDETRRSTGYWLGVAYLQQGESRQALDQFQSVDQPPSRLSTDYLEARGIAHERVGNPEQAAKSFQEALKDINDSERYAEVEYRLARVRFEEGNYEESTEILDRLQARELPRGLLRSVVVARANLFYETENQNNLRTLLDERGDLLREEAPTRYHLLAGWVARKNQDYQRAVRAYETVLKEYSQSTEARTARQVLFQLALEHPEETDYSEEQTRQLIDAADTDRASYLWRDWADHERNQGNFETARTYYERVLADEGPSALRAEAFAGMVQTWLKQEELEEASEFVQTRDNVPVHPTAAQGFYRVLREAYRTQRYEIVSAIGQRFLDLYSLKNAPGDVVFMMAEYHRFEDNAEESRDLYSQVVEGDAEPDIRDRAALRLAELALDDGRIEEGNRWLDRIQDPGRFGSDQAINLTIAQLRYFGERTEQARDALERLESTPTVEILRGKILIQAGEPEEARQVLEEIEFPGDQATELHPERLFWLGRAQEAMGNLETAQENYYEVRYRYPDWNDMDRVLDRLESVLEELGREEEAQTVRDQQRREQD